MAKKNGGLSALAQLSAGRRPVRTIPFPGTDEMVGLRLPTEADWDNARLSAMAFMADHGVNTGEGAGPGLYQREVLTRLLASCLVYPDADDLVTPYCNGVDDLKAGVTNSERDILTRELLDFADEQNPDLDTEDGMSSAMSLLAELEKKAVSRAAITVALRNTRPSMLRTLLLGMVLRSASSADSKSSDTSS